MGHPAAQWTVWLVFKNYYKGLFVATYNCGCPKMSSLSSYEDCPIAGTFCRMRWFLRYARGEGRLCRLSNPILIER